jgi:RNA-binding protein
MEPLKGFQKKYLRGLAHDLKPIVLIGKEGLMAGVVRAVNEGLARHELIKIKFIDCKEKEQKEEMTADLSARTGSETVGMIGHTVTLYKEQPDPEKRKIAVPTREGVRKKADTKKITRG